jgi:hypothetical protein
MLRASPSPSLRTLMFSLAAYRGNVRDVGLNHRRHRCKRGGGLAKVRWVGIRRKSHGKELSLLADCMVIGWHLSRRRR